MKIEFVERNYDIGKRLKDLLTQKVNKLDRYFGDGAKARIVCSLQNKTYKLEVTIINKGVLYRSEVTGENMYENLDLALPKIERQILKQSEKRRQIFRPTAFDFADLLFLDEKPKEEKKEIIKRKLFSLEPMTIEDAEINMESLEHDFYVFLNIETKMVNVLYKRKDGELGLIECVY